MRILKAKIENFKSLKDVELDFGNITILIGRNSSGKSNLMEALSSFFNFFGPEYEEDISNVPDLLWYDRNIDNNIKIIITVKLDKKEFTYIFSEETSTDKIKKLSHKQLTICRELSFKPPNGAMWRTSYVALNDDYIIKNNVFDISKRAAKITLKGDPVHVVVPIINRPSNEKENIKQIFANMSNLFKKAFYLIPAVRNEINTASNLGTRSDTIPQSVLTAMVNMEQNGGRKEVQIWSKITDDFIGIPAISELKVREGNQMRCKEGYNYFPLSDLGGGNQEVIALTFFMRSLVHNIFAIEEPETHLHSTLSRRLFNIMKDVCENKQIIISTHSPIFIDTLNLDYAWIFRKDGLETKPYRIQKAENLKLISYELGIRPSDIFFADRILFVEGSIDKMVYQIWADKKNIDLASARISVIPLRGKTRGKRHLKAWNEVTRNIHVSIYVILDNDAQAEANKLVDNGLINRRQISILSKGAVEDYYDVEILMNVMEEIYGAEISQKLQGETLNSKRLMSFLRQKHRTRVNIWRAKADIAEKVANKTPKEKIDDEIVNILEKVETYLRI